MKSESGTGSGLARPDVGSAQLHPLAFQSGHPALGDFPRGGEEVEGHAFFGVMHSPGAGGNSRVWR